METKIEMQDLDDISLCGRYYLDEEKRNLFYSLKNSILEKYAMPYQYALQEWDDLDYDSGWENRATGQTEYDVYATHQHILKRYFLSTQDGKYISREFHIPTNEFRYIIWNSFYPSKMSFDFLKLLDLCNDTIKGKKKKDYTENPAVQDALSRLNDKFGFLLKEEQNV